MKLDNFDQVISFIAAMVFALFFLNLNFLQELKVKRVKKI
jgi:hypothetical protein